MGIVSKGQTWNKMINSNLNLELKERTLVQGAQLLISYKVLTT